MYRKSLHVFWAQTDNGMLIQNINSNHFVELNQVQGRIWEYLDGTFSDHEISNVLLKYTIGISQVELLQTVQSTILLLLENDLIESN